MPRLATAAAARSLDPLTFGRPVARRGCRHRQAREDSTPAPMGVGRKWLRRFTYTDEAALLAEDDLRARYVEHPGPRRSTSSSTDADVAQLMWGKLVGFTLVGLVR